MHLPAHLGTVMWFRRQGLRCHRVEEPVIEAAVQPCACCLTHRVLDRGRGTREAGSEGEGCSESPNTASHRTCWTTLRSAPPIGRPVSSSTVVCRRDPTISSRRAARCLGSFCTSHLCGHLTSNMDRPHTHNEPAACEALGDVVHIRKPPRTLHLQAQRWSGSWR